MKNEKLNTSALAIGVMTGLIIGVLTDNIGLWISLGTAIGAGIGYQINKKSEKDTADKK